MTQRLVDRYRGLVCDLDGVVYAGPDAIPHAPEALGQVRGTGCHIVYATNNASRPPAAVAEHLQALGVRCESADVINSSMAGAFVLAKGSDEGLAVLAVGGEGVALALSDAGLRPVSPSERAQGTPVSAVLQGYGADVRASDLAEVAYAVQGGARWVATNTDSTLPTDRGRAPGNGSLVGAVRCAVEVDPEVVGKPTPVMYELATQRMSLSRGEVLAVGDRLETDIEGAVAGGFDSVLTLTGVHGWSDAAAAAPERRPTYVVADLRGLLEEYAVTPVRDGVLERSGVRLDLASAEPVGSGQPSIEDLRGVLGYCWAETDAGNMSASRAADLMRTLCATGEGR